MKVLSVLVAVIIIACYAISAEAEANQKRLKVGLPLGLSGIAAEHSENIRRGVELAKLDLERAGWVVALEYEDTTAAPAKVVSSIQSLLSKGHKLFIGPTWSYMVAAAKPLYERNDAVAISPITSTETTDGTAEQIRNYFRTMSPYKGMGGTYRFDKDGNSNPTPWLIRKAV